MTREDRRTAEQQRTHTTLIGGTDPFLSGWGEAKGGRSFAFWACRPEIAEHVLGWVQGRGDLRRVRIETDRPGRPYRPGRTCAHLSIYVVAPGHPAHPEGSE